MKAKLNTNRYAILGVDAPCRKSHLRSRIPFAFRRTVQAMIEAAVFVIVLILWVAATFGPGIYVLRPLDRAARQRKARIQFTITDFLALTAHLSIPLGLIGPLSSARVGDRNYEVVLVAFGCLAAFLIWWGTVRTAASAGITRPLKRLLMIGLVVPVAYVSAIVFGVLCPMLVLPFFRNPSADSWLYLLAMGLVAVFIACRRLVDWILQPEVEVVAEEESFTSLP